MTLASRLVAHTPATSLLVIPEWLASLPTAPVFKPGAIVVFPVCGDMPRLVYAKLLARLLPEARMLIAGDSNDQIGGVPFSADALGARFDLEWGSKTVCTSDCHNTKDQADWTIRMALTLNIRSLALVVTPWHLVRAYLTLVAAVMKLDKEQWPIVLPTPAPVPFGYIVPENGLAPSALIPGEEARIRMYQKRGDVATFRQLQRYLKWLWERPEFAPFRI